jgi:hypothetical protein
MEDNIKNVKFLSIIEFFYCPYILVRTFKQILQKKIKIKNYTLMQKIFLGTGYYIYYYSFQIYIASGSSGSFT